MRGGGGDRPSLVSPLTLAVRMWKSADIDIDTDIDVISYEAVVAWKTNNEGCKSASQRGS